MADETDIKVSTVKAHTREVKKRPVTFVCRVCHQEYTVDQYPGRPPEICLNCWPEYRRKQKAEAARRRRARTKKTEKVGV